MLKINIIKLNILDNIIGRFVKLSSAVITTINITGWDFSVAGRAVEDYNIYTKYF